VREAAAHHAGVGLDGDGRDADAREELLVGRLHREVALDRGLVVGVEGVRIHHHELAGPHQAVAGPDLVPELRGDLVEILGQVAVAGDLGAHERGDDLLVGRAEHELRVLRAALAVAGTVGAEHDLAGGGPARALLPELGRVHVGHPELDAAGAVELLAAELGQLLHDAQAEGQVRVKAAAELANEARADEQLVGGDFRVRRALLEGGNKKLRPEFHEARHASSGATPAQIYLRAVPAARLCQSCPPPVPAPSPGP